MELTLSIDTLFHDDEEKYLAWVLACMVPYRDAPQPPPPAPGRRMPPPIAASVAREGIKATNKVSDVITASVRNCEDISTRVQTFCNDKRHPSKHGNGQNDAAARDVVGMAIRQWGPTWRLQVVFALLSDIANGSHSVDGQCHLSIGLISYR